MESYIMLAAGFLIGLPFMINTFRKVVVVVFCLDFVFTAGFFLHCNFLRGKATFASLVAAWAIGLLAAILISYITSRMPIRNGKFN